jgi:hypothetical protein
MVPYAAGRRRAACRLLAAAVVRLIPAAADLLWFRGRSASAPGQVWPAAVSAKAPAMADRRRAAWHLPVVSRWAAPDRKAEWLAESYSESGSLLERPMAVARARAKQQRRLQQCRLLQYRRWTAMI